VIVNLRDGRAMPGKALAAFAVGFDDGGMDLFGMASHPAHQGRPEVEADARIIVDDLGDAFVGGEDARGGVRRVAFRRDALVPVVVRVSRILQLDLFEPGVFARRLVEVSVDTDLTIHSLAPVLQQTSYLCQLDAHKSSQVTSDENESSARNSSHHSLPS
jgi:hypothetical protein